MICFKIDKTEINSQSCSFWVVVGDLGRFFGRVKIHNPTEFITDTIKSYWLLDPSSSPLGFFVSLLQPSRCCRICFRSLSKLLCRSKRCCSTAALIVLSKMLKRKRQKNPIKNSSWLHSLLNRAVILKGKSQQIAETISKYLLKDTGYTQNFI